jgi:hypothetical protein
MADIGTLPTPGQKPWNLNPAIEAINEESSANAAEIAGRLSDESLDSKVAQAIASSGGSGPVLSDALPSDTGSPSAGTSSDASRADHIHRMPTLQAVTEAGAVTTAPIKVNGGVFDVAVTGKGNIGLQAEATNVGTYSYGDNAGVYALGGTLGLEARGGAVGAQVRGGTTAIDAASESGVVAIVDAADGNPSDITQFRKDGVTVAAVKNDGRIKATAGVDPTDAVTKSQLDAAVAGTTIPDASSAVKGKLRLTGDLGGTADAPTVPALASKADLVAGKVPASQLPAVPIPNLEAVVQAGNQSQTGIDVYTPDSTVAVAGYSSSGAGMTASSSGGTGMIASSDNATGLDASSTFGVASKHRVSASSTENISEFYVDETLVSAVKNDGRMTASPGVDPTDVAVVSQLGSAGDPNPPITAQFDWAGGAYQTYVIPEGATRLSIVTIGGGGAGGAGFSRPAGSPGGGGGGGGSGSITNADIPVHRLGGPTLSVFVAPGGTNDRTFVATLAGTTSRNMLCSAGPGVNGGAGTASAAGTAGGAGSSSISNNVLISLGFMNQLTGQSGVVGGAPSGADGAATNWGSTGAILGGGAGGAGCTTTNFAGGAMAAGGSALVSSMAGGAAGGGNGIDGQENTGSWVFTGGTGGGSNNAGVGGRGGDGAIGSGGGGGGAGVTGGAGGAGGRGRVYVTAYF